MHLKKKSLVEFATKHSKVRNPYGIMSITTTHPRPARCAIRNFLAHISSTITSNFLKNSYFGIDRKVSRKWSRSKLKGEENWDFFRGMDFVFNFHAKSRENEAGQNCVWNGFFIYREISGKWNGIRIEHKIKLQVCLFSAFWRVFPLNFNFSRQIKSLFIFGVLTSFSDLSPQFQ